MVPEIPYRPRPPSFSTQSPILQRHNIFGLQCRLSLVSRICLRPPLDSQSLTFRRTASNWKMQSFNLASTVSYSPSVSFQNAIGSTVCSIARSSTTSAAIRTPEARWPDLWWSTLIAHYYFDYWRRRNDWNNIFSAVIGGWRSCLADIILNAFHYVLLYFLNVVFYRILRGGPSN